MIALSGVPRRLVLSRSGFPTYGHYRANHFKSIELLGKARKAEFQMGILSAFAVAGAWGGVLKIKALARDPTAYLPDFSLISAMSPFTTTVVPNGRANSANRSNM